jgi:hypothetical protein
MKLTDKTRWRYDRKNWVGRHQIDAIKKRDEWLETLYRLLPRNDKKNYLEIGASPGIYTASLVEKTPWSITGIDYSDDADLFLANLDLVGKKASLIKADIFDLNIDEKFDIVCSFGLIEHFRGETLDKVFQIHDSFATKGSFVVIQMPNFTGINYFWHYLFDRPDLDNHNIDAMQPSSLRWFENNGYEVIYNDYIGVLRLWGNSGWLNYKVLGKAVAGTAVFISFVVRFFDRLGFKFFRGRTWSPALLFVAKKIN